MPDREDVQLPQLGVEMGRLKFLDEVLVGIRKGRPDVAEQIPRRLVVQFREESLEKRVELSLRNDGFEKVRGHAVRALSTAVGDIRTLRFPNGLLY